MKRFKKLVLCTSMAVLALSMTACGGKKEKESETKTVDKNHVFREKSLSELLQAVELTEVHEVVLAGSRVYFQGAYYTSDYSVYDSDRYGSVNLDGSDPKHFSLSANRTEDGMKDSIIYPEAVEEETEDTTSEENATDTVSEEDASEENVTADVGIMPYDTDYNYDNTYSNVSYSSMNVTAEGNILLLKNSYSESYEGEEWIYENEYYFSIFDQEGNLITETKIEQQPSDEDDYFSISNVILAENGTIYSLENGNKVTVFDSNYQRLKSVEVEDIDYINTLYVSGNHAFVTAWDTGGENMYLYALKEGTDSFSEAMPVPKEAYNGTLYQGSGKYDFYICSDKEVKGWNIGDEESTEILDFIDSDAGVSYVSKIFSISEEDFLVIYNDSYEWKTCFSEFTKVAPEDVKDKKVITLACRYLDNQVKKQLITFNKKSEDYRIQIMDYSQYDTYGDYTAGVTRLNNDIAAGVIPDIFVLDESVPADSYIEKGLFADLKKYIEQEEGMSLDMYAQNVIDAFSEDGKWYCLTPSFYIQTYVAKESLVGNKTNWSIQDAKELLSTLSEDATLFEQKTRADVLREGMYYMGKYFVDWKTGTCRFDSEEFITFLEFANQFPQDFDWEDDEYWNNYWESYETMYRENRTVLMSMYMSSIQEMNYNEQGRMGEKVSFVGFPTVSGTGSYLIPTIQLAMSEKSSVKDGAWEFIKYFLSDEYQLSDEINGFPLSMAGLEKLVEKAQQRPYYYDEEGNKVEYDDYYYFEGGDIKLDPMTEERAREILSFVLSVDNRMTFDDDVMNLIQEEAESYFTGQKSAKEAAEVIQSRAQIYVSEHM